MGLAFERLHSYEPAPWIFGLFMVFASILIVCLSRCRYPIERKIRAVDIPANERA
jgi:hypothetical protein